jgi:broad specificity phosphatase PhoE
VRAIFLRHGQSTGNAGIPCNDLALLELTEEGWRQAREVAADWTESPSLIVTSPYLRTRQTAQPTIERFPDVSVEVWPIQEFTYLRPSRWNGTLSVDRLPHIKRYWNTADTEYCDGEGAESFGTLLRRVEASLARLERMPDNALIYLFSHGQFIQAARSIIIEREKTAREKMQQFWRPGFAAISNAERVCLEWSIDGWRLE